MQLVYRYSHCLLFLCLAYFYNDAITFLSLSVCSTIVYELMSLEHAYKHLPAECVIWRVGQGKMQPVTLLPKGNTLYKI